MNRIIVDQSTVEALANLQRPSELCDGSGRVLGYFTPATEEPVYDETDIPVTEEELDRRSRNGGGRTLSEIMADLEKRQ